MKAKVEAEVKEMATLQFVIGLHLNLNLSLNLLRAL